MLRTTVALGALLMMSTAALAEDWGSFYAEVYGGAHTTGTAIGNGFGYPITAGGVLGASIGLMTPVPGLAVELDVMGTTAEYVGYVGQGGALETTTFMVDAEYTIPLNDMFEVYGMAGVGLYNIHYRDIAQQHSSGTGAGYQVAIGARAHVTDHVSITAELKHQSSFSTINITGTGGTFDESYPTTSGLLGLRFSF